MMTGAEQPNNNSTPKSAGRPVGTSGIPKEASAKKDLHSVDYIQDVVKETDAFRQTTMAKLKKENQIKRFTKKHKDLLDRLCESVITSSELGTWSKNADRLIKNPKSIISLETITEINNISVEHQLDTYSAALLYHSKNLIKIIFFLIGVTNHMKSYNESKSPFKYTTVFSQNSLASIKVGEENNISLASLDPLQPLIPEEVDLGRNIDLLGVAFNAAVANKFNNNGDGIETNTALAIKDYFIHKPTNIEHDRSRVVGHIVNAGISAYGQESSELIPEEELKGTYSPFHISLAAVVYRIVNSDFANLINDSSDPEHENYQMVSASWELGFNEYLIALGSDDLTEAELISDEGQVEELSQYLVTQGGAGKMKDGTKVNRLVVGDVYPLGIGFTATPAADVKGLITKKEKDSKIIF